MPIHHVKGGYKWGSHGHTYPSKAGARRQAAAAYAHGYKGKSAEPAEDDDLVDGVQDDEDAMPVIAQGSSLTGMGMRTDPDRHEVAVGQQRPMDRFEDNKRNAISPGQQRQQTIEKHPGHDDQSVHNPNKHGSGSDEQPGTNHTGGRNITGPGASPWDSNGKRIDDNPNAAPSALSDSKYSQMRNYMDTEWGAVPEAAFRDDDALESMVGELVDEFGISEADAETALERYANEQFGDDGQEAGPDGEKHLQSAIDDFMDAAADDYMTEDLSEIDAKELTDAFMEETYGDDDLSEDDWARAWTKANEMIKADQAKRHEELGGEDGEEDGWGADELEPADYDDEEQPFEEDPKFARRREDFENQYRHQDKALPNPFKRKEPPALSRPGMQQYKPKTPAAPAQRPSGPRPSAPKPSASTFSHNPWGKQGQRPSAMGWK